MVIPRMIRKPGPTDRFTISSFRPLECELERGQAAFSLAAFTIEVSNINSLKINKTYTEWGFEDSSSAAFLLGSLWLGRRPGTCGFRSSFSVGKDILVVINRNHELEMYGKAIVRTIVRIIRRESVSRDRLSKSIICAIVRMIIRSFSQGQSRDQTFDQNIGHSSIGLVLAMFVIRLQNNSAECAYSGYSTGPGQKFSSW